MPTLADHGCCKREQLPASLRVVFVPVSSAVDQQGQAAKEISSNVQAVSRSSSEVSSSITGVNEAAAHTGAAAEQVLGAARELSQQSEMLNKQVGDFVTRVRAA